MASIYPIVEGHGEVKAVPILLRRLGTEVLGLSEVRCFPPHRLPRNKLLNASELSRALALAHAKLRATTEGRKLVLVLMDADNDCPVELMAAIRAAHGEALARTQSSIVFAVREFEAWFIAANLAEQHHRDLRPGVRPHPDPESIADAKGVFERDHLKEGRTYSETVDQPKFLACLDLVAARRSASFDKLVRDLRTALIS